MAKVATHASMPPTALRYGDDRLKVGSGNKAKRKTPSELRGEQLKRRSAVEFVDDPIPPLSNSLNEIHGLKKPDPPKNPRYIETRMDGIFPVRKPTCRLKMLSGKTTTKENISSGLYKQDNISNELNDNMKNYPGLSKMAGKSQSIFSWSDISMPPPTLSKDGAVQTCQAAEKFSEKHFLNNTAEDKALTGHFSRESPTFSCLPKDGAEDPVASAAVPKDSRPQTCETTEKGIHNTFRNVAELASTLEKSSCPAVVDMDKALKGLVSHGPISSCFSAKSSEHFGESTMVGNFCSEFHIPGQKMPLDFTLKTTMQVLASTSVNWFHRFITSGDYCGRPQFSSQLSCWSEQNISHSYGIPSTPTDEILKKSFSLHSWVYPESSFPPAVVSALALSAAGGAESDFLSKRQSAWEDSLRCLYYMLRKNVCNIFYVCTPQFVVMFTAGYGSGRSRQSCNAYMSRSTRGLRSLLSEHDVRYHMPLRQSKVEEVSTEDLLDLFEMEKDNPGQTRRLNSLLDVDNSPESLLAFSGNENVHGLYDFLLNYRSFLTSLHGVDVPALYSPVPFRNATLSIPEVRCKEMRSADHIALSLNGSDMKNTNSKEDSSVGLCHSIEIKGLYLPPWIISNMCAVMGFEGRSFEASFITEPSSIGLNAALATASPKSNLQNKEGEAHKDISHDFGFKDAVHSPFLHSASLRGLKYSNGSYTASLSPI